VHGNLAGWWAWQCPYCPKLAWKLIGLHLRARLPGRPSSWRVSNVQQTAGRVGWSAAYLSPRRLRYAPRSRSPKAVDQPTRPAVARSTRVSSRRPCTLARKKTRQLSCYYVVGTSLDIMQNTRTVTLWWWKILTQVQKCQFLKQWLQIMHHGSFWQQSKSQHAVPLITQMSQLSHLNSWDCGIPSVCIFISFPRAIWFEMYLELMTEHEQSAVGIAMLSA